MRTGKAMSGRVNEEGFPRAEGRGREGGGFGDTWKPPAFQGLQDTQRLVEVTRGVSIGMFLDPDFLALFTAQKGSLVRAPPRSQVHLVNHGGRLRGPGCLLQRRRSRGAHIGPYPPLSHMLQVPGGRSEILTIVCSATMFRLATESPSIPAELV